MDWTSKIYPDRFAPVQPAFKRGRMLCFFGGKPENTHTSTKTNIKYRMKKIIPTMFAIALAISSISLLVGCDTGPAEDPDADANQKQEATMDDENMTADEKTKLDDSIKPPPEVPAPGK